MDKDLRNSTDPAIELQKICERIEEIEKEGADLVKRRQNAIHDSIEEQELMITHMELTEEKATLVRRQDYYNDLADLNETKEKVASVREQISKIGNLFL